MNSPKRILMLTHEFPPFRGGIARYSAQLAVAAAELGHQVTVLAPDFNQDCSNWDQAQAAIKVTRYKAATYHPGELHRLVIRAMRWARATGFDIVHAVDPSYVMALAFTSRFRNLSYVATVYGTDVLGLRTSLQARLLGAHRMFERPERLFAISRFTKALLQQHCPKIPDDRIAVTSLGVNQFWFEQGSDDAAVIRNLELDIDRKIILTVARLDSRKGHRAVLKSIAQLEADLKVSTTYVIAGSGSDAAYAQELHELAALSGCDVRFLPDLSDEQLRALYKASYLFCMPGEPHPAKVEGFGLVYLEAAAQGLPSIGTDLGAIPEVVKHERTGLIVPPLDSGVLTASIRRMLLDAPLRKRLGEAARIDAATYSWQRCARETYGEAS